MRYTTAIEVAQPRAEVLRLISDPTQMPKWLRGLVRHEPTEGRHGQVGTTSRVVFQVGKQRMEATETITRVEPTGLDGLTRTAVVHYEREIVAPGMWQAQRDRLSEPTPGTTRWESESEYRFDGVLMRVVGVLLPGVFRAQSRRHMQDFKAFAEHGTDVRGTAG